MNSALSSISQNIESVDQEIDSLDKDDTEMRELLEMKELLRDMRQSITEVVSSQRDLDDLDVRAQGVLLVFHTRIHIGTYTRLGTQRLLAWSGRHLFVLLGSVLVLGMGYSSLVQAGRSLFANWLSLGFWALLLVAFAFAVFKEYVLSRKLKTLRISVERRLLIPVVHQIFLASLQGLLSETLTRQPEAPKQRLGEGAFVPTVTGALDGHQS